MPVKRPSLAWSVSIATAFCLLVAALFLAGCAAMAVEAVQPTARAQTSTPSVTLPAATSTPQPSATPAPSATAGDPALATSLGTDLPTAAPTSTPTPDARLTPADWQNWPVIPTLSPHALQVLQQGAAAGNNPRAFSKVGDCETITDWFLNDFDRGSRFYNLGPYSSLQPVIDYFAGSFQHKSAASARGFTAASALSPIWADPKVCQPGETPLGCEYRLQKPILAFIMLGTNDVNHKATFEANLRKIIDQTLAEGILPILVTKADNLEGDHQLNLTIARLAYEYDLPLWNFWRAVQGLPNGGLQEDGAHLTYTPNYFDDPQNLQSAWAVRNLTALQVLQVVMQAEK